MSDSESYISDSDSDSIPPPPPPLRLSLSQHYNNNITHINENNTNYVSLPPLRKHRFSRDDNNMPRLAKARTSIGREFSGSYSLRREPIVQIQQYIQSLEDIKSIKLKNVLFRLSAFLNETANCEEFINQSGHKKLFNAVLNVSGNTLSYGIKALRALCRHPKGSKLVLKNEELLIYLFRLLLEQKAINITCHTVALLVELVKSSHNHGFQKIDNIAIKISKETQSPPYIYLTTILEQDGAELELKKDVLVLINAILMHSIGTSVEEERCQLFDKFQISRICADLSIDYEPFVEQLHIFDKFCNNSDENRSNIGVSNLNMVLTRSNADMKSKLKDLTELISVLRQQKNSVETELIAYKRRENLVGLMWDEIINLRTQLDTAVSLGYNVSPNAPSRRHDQKFDDEFSTSFSSGNMQSLTSQHHSYIQSNVISPFASALQFNPKPVLNYKSPSAPMTTNISTTKNVNNNTNIPNAPNAPPIAPNISNNNNVPMAPTVAKIEPNKKEINPKAKMKPLHWKRIILPSDAPSNIWREIDEVDLDEDELVNLFQQKSGAVNVKKQLQQVETKLEKMALLPNKRHQAISIVMNVLPPTEEVIKAIFQLDCTKILNRQTFAKLMAAFPTEEELLVVKEAAKDVKYELDPAESFVVALAQIPQISARMECWQFMLSFDELLQDILKPFDYLVTAFNAIKKSKCFRQSLSLILSIGNYMNGGTKRGQADGFELSAFQRLGSIKDTVNGEISLIEYIGKKAMKSFDKKFHTKLLEELKSLKNAEGYTLRSVISEARMFINNINTVKREISLVVVAMDDSTDRFERVMQEFITKAESKITIINNEIENAHQTFLKLLRYLQPGLSQAEINRIQSHMIINGVYEFARDLNSVMTRYLMKLEMQQTQEKRKNYNAQMIAALKARK